MAGLSSDQTNPSVLDLYLALSSSRTRLISSSRCLAIARSRPGTLPWAVMIRVVLLGICVMEEAAGKPPPQYRGDPAAPGNVPFTPRRAFDLVRPFGAGCLPPGRASGLLGCCIMNHSRHRCDGTVIA